MNAKINILKVFRYLTITSLCLYLISAYATGVGFGQAGRYESFVFLLVASGILIVTYCLTCFIDDKNVSRIEKYGLILMLLPMLSIALILMICDYQAFIGSTEWNHASTTLFFLTAIPSTVLFSLGFLVIIYGIIRKKIINSS